MGFSHSGNLAMCDCYQKGIVTSVEVIVPSRLRHAWIATIHYIGYENVASDRQGVTDLFLDARVKHAIEKRGIRLVSFKEVAK